MSGKLSGKRKPVAEPIKWSMMFLFHSLTIYHIRSVNTDLHICLCINMRELLATKIGEKSNDDLFTQKRPLCSRHVFFYLHWYFGNDRSDLDQPFHPDAAWFQSLIREHMVKCQFLAFLGPPSVYRPACHDVTLKLWVLAVDTLCCNIVYRLVKTLWMQLSLTMCWCTDTAGQHAVSWTDGLTCRSLATDDHILPNTRWRRANSPSPSMALLYFDLLRDNSVMHNTRHVRDVLLVNLIVIIVTIHN